MMQTDNSQQYITEKEKGTQRRILDDITVLIPTVGRPILQKCLQAIANGTVLPAYIVVIDQSDNFLVADWLERLKKMGLKTLHLRSMEKGPASARNLGIEHIRTPFVAAIDDDCVAESDWLEKMGIQLHKNPEIIITGRVDPSGDGIAPTIITSNVPHLYCRPLIRVTSPLASGNMGFALRTARYIGPFDKDLLTAEDIDWAYRALRVGISILYTPEIIVSHFHWRNNSQLAAAYHAYAWGLGTFYGKHLRRGDWSMVARTVLSLFRGVRDLFYGVIDNDHARRANGYARVTWLLPGLFTGLRGLGSP